MKPTILCLLAALLIPSGYSHGENSGKDIPPEPDNFEWGVVRAWRSAAGDVLEKPGAKELSAGLGDAVVVEVKNFNGWVIHCADLFGSVDASLFKDLAPGVRSIVQGRQLKLAAHASRVMRKAADGLLNAKEIADYRTEGVLQAADVEALQKLPAPPEKPPVEIPAANPNQDLTQNQNTSGGNSKKRAPRRHPLAPGDALAPADVVEAVLTLPSFVSLNTLFTGKPDEKVALFSQVSQLISRLQSETASDLRLRINEVVFDGILPENPVTATKQSRPSPPNSPPGDYSWFRFQLAESEKNATEWLQFRKLILLRGSVELSLAHAFGDRQLALPSLVKYVPKGEKPAPGHHAFHLVTIHGWQLAVAIFLFTACVALFWVSANRTDLLADPEASPRADGQQPYSLARSQMAFWFILVIASFLFLWVSSGKMHVLNETCLWLIGIGAGTALGAALISDPAAAAAIGLRSRYLKRKAGENMTVFKGRVATALATATAQATDPLLVQALTEQQAELATMGNTAGRRVLDDWLTEGSGYSFHRYQMLTWTIVLGGVFIVTVCQDRTLPVFDAVMLALLGISNGTYLGFKLAKK